MRKFQYLLYALKWSYICYSIICMTIPYSFAHTKILLCIYLNLCKEYEVSLNMSETYLEPSQTSKMELSAKIVNGWKPSFFAKSSILDALSSGYTSGFRTAYYFCQKLYLRWLGELWICHCIYIVKKWINEISKVRYEKLKRKTINMFCLILWIAVRKIS